MALQGSDDVRTQAEFERLMIAARVYRGRGDYAAAADTIKKALALRPSDLDAREFAADIVYAHGDVARAAEHYKSILENDPSRISAEEKYARAVLDIAEGKRQRDLLQQVLDNPTQARVAPRSSSLAALLSIAPGFGQIYCMQYVKGMLIFGVWALAWLLCLSFVGPEGHRLSAPTLFFGCLATSLHLYAVVDAASAAEKTRPGKELTEP